MPGVAVQDFNPSCSEGKGKSPRSWRPVLGKDKPDSISKQLTEERAVLTSSSTPAFLACMKPWVWSIVLQKRKELVRVLFLLPVWKWSKFYYFGGCAIL
jgi:hypothetical protein